MDTSYYKNFVTLVDTDNMTQAADILHITQPALSKQLKFLEAEFGTPLLIIRRGQRGRNFHLTDAGKIFYDKAKQLCAIEESAYFDVKRLHSDIEGSLRFACAASRSTYLIHHILYPFSQKYPAIKYEIYEGLSNDVENALLRGSAEFGICAKDLVDISKFEELAISEENLYAVFRRDIFWSNAQKDALIYDDLASVPLSLCGASAHILINNYKDAFSKLNVLSVTTTKSSAIEWAQSGHTVAIIPMGPTEIINRRKLVRMRISDLKTPFIDSLIINKGHTLSLVGQQFLEFYKAQIIE